MPRKPMEEYDLTNDPRFAPLEERMKRSKSEYDLTNDPRFAPLGPPEATSYATLVPQEEEMPAGAPVATPTATPEELPPKPPVPTLETVQKTEQTTTTTEPGFKPSAGALQEQEKAFGAQERATTELAKAQQAGVEAEVYARRRMETEKLQEAEKVQKQQQDYKKNLANEMNKYESAYKELADANKVEINPRAYIDRMSTSSKLMVGFGLLLSGFGGSDSVTKSMSIFNKAVDDDIAAQKIAREGKIEAAKTGIASIDKKVQSVRDNLKDDNAFYELQRDLRFGAIQSQIEQAIAKAKSPEIEAKLQQGLAQIQQQRADSRMKLEEMARDKSKTVSVTGKEEKFGVKQPGTGLTKEQMERTGSYRKEIMADPQVKSSVETLGELAPARASWKIAKQGDPAALKNASILIATAIQKGTLSQKDVEGAAGVPVGLLAKGSDAIQQYVFNQAPANQMATMKKLLDAAENSARNTYQQRVSGYEAKARDELGFTDQEVKAAMPVTPAGITPEKKKAPAGPAVGTIEGGYRFKGGDPSKQSSWEKVK